MGTLFDLDRVRQSLVDLGGDPVALDAWFQRIPHETAAVTMLDSYRPFKELAACALKTTLARLGLRSEQAAPLDALADLDPHPDAADALRQLRGAGFRTVVLTNGSVDSTKNLLERGRLDELVEAIMSCDEVQRFKPHPAPYELAGRPGGARVAVPARSAATRDRPGRRRAAPHDA